MNMVELKVIARAHGIKVGTMRKAELIKAIQRAEGNEDCYATGKSHVCCQHDCLWRDDCE